MVPDILLLGANGQVGWELRRSLAPVGRVIALSRSDVDLSDIDALVRTVRTARASIIVNAAAYTAVDKAEADNSLASRLNAEVPAVLAEETKRRGGILVDYSTDYVFDGTLDRAYNELDKPNPLGVYGRTKLEGLRAIESSGCRHLVFRVSWVYGAHGSNFVKTILRLARERNELKVVDDQTGAPTPADLIADITAHALIDLSREKVAPGAYHLAPSGKISWCGFAREVVVESRKLGEQLALTENEIAPIATADYPTAARRPLNSLLDTSKLQSGFGLHLPHWREPLARIIREIVAK